MYDLVVTKHAHEQYCRRVEEIDRNELIRRLKSEIKLDKPPYYLFRALNSWWVREVNGKTIVVVTCYGNGHMDIPKALRWAKMHNDRLRFDDDVI
jgi:hypothetical protein